MCQPFFCSSLAKSEPTWRQPEGLHFLKTQVFCCRSTGSTVVRNLQWKHLHLTFLIENVILTRQPSEIELRRSNLVPYCSVLHDIRVFNPSSPLFVHWRKTLNRSKPVVVVIYIVYVSGPGDVIALGPLYWFGHDPHCSDRWRERCLFQEVSADVGVGGQGLIVLMVLIAGGNALCFRKYPLTWVEEAKACLLYTSPSPRDDY